MKASKTFGKFLLFAILIVANQAFAQAPENYYSSADGKKGSALKTVMGEIISKGAVNLGYSALWSAYKTTDLRPDGRIWDMYSDITNFDPANDRAGTYKKEGDTYNREHSFPKSWFNEASPMVADLMHVVPTDGYVNGQRSNLPYGEVSSVTYSSHAGFSKKGTCKSSIGYNGTVFEPNDEYKGDFARIYFYMATRYDDKIQGWDSPMLSGNRYPAYTNWAMQMLLRWAQEDPVSQKEIDRNNGVYELQHNRNPFVDFPGLEQYVWGSYKDVAFNSKDYLTPDGTAPDTPDTPGGGEGGDDEKPGTDNPPTGSEDPGVTYTKYEKISDESGLVIGGKYLIVCESKDAAMANTSTDIRSYISVSIEGDVIETKVGEGSAHAFILGGVAGAYTLKDETEGKYLSYSGSNNKLFSEDAFDTTNQQWNITFNSGNAIIENNGVKGRFILFNASSPRFACYKSGQQQVQMYKGVAPSAINSATYNRGKKMTIYSISGQRVNDINAALPGLYIINGRKVFVR